MLALVVLIGSWTVLSWYTAVVSLGLLTVMYVIVYTQLQLTDVLTTSSTMPPSPEALVRVLKAHCPDVRARVDRRGRVIIKTTSRRTA